MGIEIERKFLVTSDEWRNSSPKIVFTESVKQGYLSKGDVYSVCVGTANGTDGWVSIKTSKPGLSRAEYEYLIPHREAVELIERCEDVIVKTRYFIGNCGTGEWHIDVFEGNNQGLVLAEIEIHTEDQEIAKPSWLGEEVTGNPAFYNNNLAVHPYNQWRRPVKERPDV